MSAQKILIIDDDETTHTLLESVLSDYGYETLHAHNGEEGLSTLQETNDIDAVLLDRQMPVMNGNDVLKAINQNPEGMQAPIIMVTSDNNIEDVTESLNLGAKDYIVKPFDNESLIIRLQNALNK